MIIIISPAKTLKFNQYSSNLKYSEPIFAHKALELAKHLKSYTSNDLMRLMKISEKLGDLNAQRYSQFSKNPDEKMAQPAILTFMGDVFAGMEAWTFSDETMQRAQSNLVILSGLYGALRPLDKIQAHRLEMGTRLPYKSYKNLYEYWREDMRKYFQQRMEEQGTNVILNLASEEYSKSIDFGSLNAKVISPQFKNNKNDELKMNSIYAKRERGLMTRFVLENNIENPEHLRAFDLENYIYNEDLSEFETPLFVR